MLSSKTIKGKTLEEYVEMCFDITKWLEVFNSNGKDIFGEEYDSALFLLGIANMRLSRPLNDFVDIAEQYATKLNNQRNRDFLKQFNIKLEGDDDTKPS